MHVTASANTVDPAEPVHSGGLLIVFFVLISSPSPGAVLQIGRDDGYNLGITFHISP